MKSSKIITAIILAANFVALSSLYTASNISVSYAHSNHGKKGLEVELISSKEIGDQLSLEILIINTDDYEYQLEALYLNEIKIASLDAGLKPKDRLELSGDTAVQIPGKYATSRFMSFRLHIKDQNPLIFPIVASP